MVNRFYNIENLNLIEVNTEPSEYNFFFERKDYIEMFLNFFRKEKKDYMYYIAIFNGDRFIGDTISHLANNLNKDKFSKNRFIEFNEKLCLKPYAKLCFVGGQEAIRFFDSEYEVKEYVKQVVELKPSLELTLFSPKRIFKKD